MIISFLICVYSVFVLQFILPRVTDHTQITSATTSATPAETYEVSNHLGLERYRWAKIHGVTGWMFIILVFIYLIGYPLLSIPNYLKK